MITAIPLSTDHLDDLAIATGWVEKLELRVAERNGITRVEARKAIAEKDPRLTEGTLEGIARRRVKDVSTRVFRALSALVVAEITKGIKELDFELEIARRADLHMDPAALSQAEAALAHAKAAIRTN